MKYFVVKAAKKWVSKNLNLKYFKEELEKELNLTSLGGGLYKIRSRSESTGKSGGYRVVLALKKGQKCFIVYGFGKNIKTNISKDELKALKVISKRLLNLSEDELKKYIKKKEIFRL
ncbi:MAG: type II toxin-antitoxin system RelE/ParE family toxin [Bdellovibrionales bacterium]|nr:type II toxin-antitoxin system RelE/ParE family toxin [Bdellovibrionales bacterium]